MVTHTYSACDSVRTVHSDYSYYSSWARVITAENFLSQSEGHHRKYFLRYSVYHPSSHPSISHPLQNSELGGMRKIQRQQFTLNFLDLVAHLSLALRQVANCLNHCLAKQKWRALSCFSAYPICLVL